MQQERRNTRARQMNVRTAYLEVRERCESGVAEEDLQTTLAAEGSNVRKEGWLLKLTPTTRFSVSAGTGIVTLTLPSSS